ncbi:MAG: hypothetical protein NVS4B12_19800 [Ktedonobacteraceae bacterium]
MFQHQSTGVISLNSKQLQEQRNDYMHALFTKLSEQIRPVLDTHIDFAPKVAE